MGDFFLFILMADHDYRCAVLYSTPLCSFDLGMARCSQDEPLGMEDGRIPDESITASSIYNEWVSFCGPQRARLKLTGN